MRKAQIFLKKCYAEKQLQANVVTVTLQSHTNKRRHAPIKLD
jgi:hypothetical protein